jgi:DNA-binding CsgD family transcriptional regulator
VTLSGTLTQGERKPEPAVAEKALSGLASLAAELGLTAREREVLEHLALGAAAIAHPLGLAPS